MGDSSDMIEFSVADYDILSKPKIPWNCYSCGKFTKEENLSIHGNHLYCDWCYNIEFD